MRTPILAACLLLAGAVPACAEDDWTIALQGDGVRFSSVLPQEDCSADNAGTQVSGTCDHSDIFNDFAADVQIIVQRVASQGTVDGNTEYGWGASCSFTLHDPAIGSMKLMTTRAFEPSYPAEPLCGTLQVTGGGGYNWTIVYSGG